MSGSATRTIISRFTEQKGLCVYCDVNLTNENATMDHIIPRSWGGKTSGIMNTVLACEQCNSFKSGIESHIINHMGSHLSMVERAALFMLRCMKRLRKNPALEGRFVRMAVHVQEAADEHCRQHQFSLPKHHRRKYL